MVKELEELTGLKLISGPLTSIKTLAEEQNKSLTIMNKNQRETKLIRLNMAMVNKMKLKKLENERPQHVESD